jgi:hypothetical protein
VDLRNGGVTPIHGYFPFLELIDEKRIIGPVPLRHRFKEIGLSRQGRLVLVSLSRTAWELRFMPREAALCLEHVHQEPSQHRRPFERAADAGVRYKLKTATWNDGSRAWLDFRGLLHLQSADRSLPEVTLILGERYVPGWSSTGDTWGGEYFFGQRGTIDPGTAYRTLIEPFIARLT